MRTASTLTHSSSHLPALVLPRAARTLGTPRIWSSGRTANVHRRSGALMTMAMYCSERRTAG